MANYVGALDQGTTSNRFIIFDHSGRIVGLDQKEHEQIFPKPGWVEHKPSEIWQNTQDVIRGALANAGLAGSDLASVGITNQRETTVLWDKHTGMPYTNAIVWQCTRTDEICKNLMREKGQNRFRDKTGLPIATYFSGPKIKWILDNIAPARKAAENGEALFGTMETWIIWWLTGGPAGGSHVTDVTNASRTLLMDLQTLQWDEQILKTMDIPSRILPRIVPSCDMHTWGTTLLDGPFGAKIPVCGALGDQQAALIGQAGFDNGMTKSTYGTGCFVIANKGDTALRSHNQLLTTIAMQIDGAVTYGLEGSVFVAGSAMQWLRDELRIIDSAADSEAIAKRTGVVKDIYVVPAFAGLGAPHWDPDARGAVLGLTRGSGRDEIVSATLQSVAYQTRDLIDAMADDGIRPSVIRVDGGMVANDWFLQFLADVLPVRQGTGRWIQALRVFQEPLLQLGLTQLFGQGPG